MCHTHEILIIYNEYYANKLEIIILLFIKVLHCKKNISIDFWNVNLFLMKLSVDCCLQIISYANRSYMITIYLSESNVKKSFTNYCINYRLASISFNVYE